MALILPPLVIDTAKPTSGEIVDFDSHPSANETYRRSALPHRPGLCSLPAPDPGGLRLRVIRVCLRLQGYIPLGAAARAESRCATCLDEAVVVTAPRIRAVTSSIDWS